MSENTNETETIPLSAKEFSDYIVFHAHKLSPRDLRTVAERLPAMRGTFDEVKSEKFPHTPERLRFLSDLVQAFVNDEWDELPFEAAAEAAFALIYLHQGADLIPDELPDIGFDDDATLVALVLERNAPAFRAAAQLVGHDWASLNVREHGAF